VCSGIMNEWEVGEGRWLVADGMEPSDARLALETRSPQIVKGPASSPQSDGSSQQ